MAFVLTREEVAALEASGDLHHALEVLQTKCNPGLLVPEGMSTDFYLGVASTMQWLRGRIGPCVEHGTVSGYLCVVLGLLDTAQGADRFPQPAAVLTEHDGAESFPWQC